jgi:hypothetical protein
VILPEVCRELAVSLVGSRFDKLKARIYSGSRLPQSTEQRSGSNFAALRMS